MRSRVLGQLAFTVFLLSLQALHDGPGCVDGRQQYATVMFGGGTGFHRTVNALFQVLGPHYWLYRLLAGLGGSLVYLPLSMGVHKPRGLVALALLLACNPWLYQHCLVTRPTLSAAACSLTGVALLRRRPWWASLWLGLGFWLDPTSAPAVAVLLGTVLAARLLEEPSLLQTRTAIVLVFTALLGLRFGLCCGPPTGTTDCLRTLGYAGHLSTHGWALYTTRAENFAPELWSGAWPQLSFTYPPATLLLYAGFASLGLGTFYVKLALTALEVAISLRFAARNSPWAGLLYLASPVSVWNVSHEGQFEPLLAGWLLLTIEAVRGRRWLAGGLAFALALQTKHFAVVLLPWLLLRASPRLWLGVALGFVPFVGFYACKPDLMLTVGHMLGQAGNPFTREPVSLVILLVALASRDLDLLPFVLLWVLIKVAPVAHPWYLVAAPVLLLCSSRKRLVACLLGLSLLIVLPPACVDLRAQPANQYYFWTAPRPSILRGSGLRHQVAVVHGD